MGQIGKCLHKARLRTGLARDERHHQRKARAGRHLFLSKTLLASRLSRCILQVHNFESDNLRANRLRHTPRTHNFGRLRKANCAVLFVCRWSRAQQARAVLHCARATGILRIKRVLQDQLLTSFSPRTSRRTYLKPLVLRPLTGSAHAAAANCCHRLGPEMLRFLRRFRWLIATIWR